MEGGACDPDDSCGTTTNCGTEIDFENTNVESGKCWMLDLCDHTHTKTETRFPVLTNNSRILRLCNVSQIWQILTFYSGDAEA